MKGQNNSAKMIFGTVPPAKIFILRLTSAEVANGNFGCRFSTKVKAKSAEKVPSIAKNPLFAMIFTNEGAGIYLHQ